MIEAYKIGVTLALHNKVSDGLMLISRDLAKTDAAAGKLKATLNEIKLLGGIGMAMAGAGYAGLSVLDKAYKAAKDYETAFGRFKSLNLGDAINADADKFARSANVIGVSATDLMGTMKTLQTIFGEGHYDLAKDVAPLLAQMQFANKAVFKGHGRQFDDAQMEAALKVIEMRGGWKSADDLKRNLDMMQKVMSGTGGMVMPSDMLAFLKTGGNAAKNLNEQAFYFGMEPLIQEMGGSRVGTGLMSAFQNLVLGKGTTAAAKELARLKLVDPSMVDYDKIGHVKRIKPGALIQEALYQSNTQQWVEQVLIPTLTKDGAKIDQKVIEDISYLLGNRTGAMLTATMFQQSEKIAKNVAIDIKAMGVADLIKLAQTTPEGSEAALAASWQNLKVAAGESLVPIIIPAMNKLAEALRDLGEWITHHPIRFDYLVKGFAGLSAALAFGGAVFTAAAAIKGIGLAFALPGFLGMGATASSATALGIALGPLGAILATVAAAAAGMKLMADYDAAHKGEGAPGWGWTKGLGDKIGRDADGSVHNWKLGELLGASWDYLKDHKSDIAPGIFGKAPPAQSQPIQVSTQINLDGRKIAEAVTEHQTRAATGPASSTSRFDDRADLPPSFMPAMP